MNIYLALLVMFIFKIAPVVKHFKAATSTSVTGLTDCQTKIFVLRGTKLLIINKGTVKIATCIDCDTVCVFVCVCVVVCVCESLYVSM